MLVHPTSENIFDKVKHYLTTHYAQADSLADATHTFTTLEVFDCLQEIYPSTEYTAISVSGWLEDLGYKTQETKPLRPEWLFKKIMHAENT